jgi:hypothetical protein
VHTSVFKTLKCYLTGCEYGDHVSDCVDWHCTSDLVDSDTRQQCCGTCNLGDLISTTPYTGPTRPHTSSETLPTPSMPVECTDVASVNGISCREFITMEVQHYCYDATIYSLCCLTCNAFQMKDKLGKYQFYTINA